MQEGKVCYSGKHKIYGYVGEVSVRNGLAVGCSRQHPESLSEIDSLSKNLRFYNAVSPETETEMEVDDGGCSGKRTVRLGLSF